MIPILLSARGLIALVDDEDARLADFEWGAVEKNADTFYAARMGPDRVPVYLHHEVLPECPPGLVRDHINGSGLDNRRGNLRLVSHRINSLNRPHVSGVCQAPNGKWRSYITLEGRKHKSLGVYATREEALRVRLLREKEEWGIQPRRLHLFEEMGLV